MNKVIKTLFALALVATMAGCSSDKGGAAATELKGEAQGFAGTVSVTVTVEGDKITSAKIEGADETPAIGQAAFETLEKAIVDNNGKDIDVVSGATVTSDAVIAALEAALASK